MESNLYYVIGASGSGKDTLLNGLYNKISENKRNKYLFVQRYVTRKQNICTSKSFDISLSKEEFLRLEKEGFFSLSWQSYENLYGIPKSIEHDLEMGKTLFINGSRTYLQKALEIYPHMKILCIKANIADIEKRLHSRGRERNDELKQRLANASLPIKHPCIQLKNSGTIEELISSCIDKLNLEV